MLDRHILVLHPAGTFLGGVETSVQIIGHIDGIRLTSAREADLWDSVYRLCHRSSEILGVDLHFSKQLWDKPVLLREQSKHKVLLVNGLVAVARSR